MARSLCEEEGEHLTDETRLRDLEIELARRGENRLRDIEIDLARRGERFDHIHDCLELLKAHVQELKATVSALEKTVLIKFSEMRGRENQTHRVAVVTSTIISLLIAGVGIAVAVFL